MGFFDFLKKKTENVLTLEQLLQKAATEPAYIIEFYKRLLTDELVVITQGSNHQQGNVILEKDTNVNIVMLDGKIPVFTSTERIFDNGIIKEQVDYLKLKGEDLFGFTKGATFLLNPYSNLGKELLPDEIENLLNRTFYDNRIRSTIVEKDTQVKIKQPTKYPTEMVNSLKILFAEKRNIKAAYLAWIYNPESGQPPHYIIGLDGNGNIQDTAKEAIYITSQFVEKNEFVDFVKIEENDDVSDYFTKETKPFYKRLE
ncbi:MAG: enhanced serine sensitivity protein SseB C-terminal domain-containing protein [Bacteroidetes bacterium]|nr:enhanced serine sensitivity protein SseB C-terminal domain-containing protein [Bacteroidota bacterium]